MSKSKLDFHFTKLMRMTNCLNYPKKDSCTPGRSVEEEISNCDATEIGQRFLETAKESRIHYKTSGLHVTHDEVDQWVNAIGKNPLAAPPLSHT